MAYKEAKRCMLQLLLLIYVMLALQNFKSININLMICQTIAI